MTRQALPAAVFRADDPRAADLPNTVPANARMQRVGNCVVGYTKTPIVIDGRPRQRFSRFEMIGRGNRKMLRSLMSYRLEHGVVIDDDAA